MCGIAGIYSWGERGRSDVSAMLRMIGAMAHRGPDETGVYIDDHIALGHARLSIIDLAGGAQPITNEDGSLWIVYNGEVFNYPELRARLEARGHVFSTTTDTEVILHLYEDEGAGCLERLNGQFAFAIWDARREMLFLARDRVGIRPLYYTLNRQRLIFGSEIKAIFTVEDVPRELDRAVLDQIFTYWTPLPGRSPFRDICELPPGHYALIRNGDIQVRRYWDIPLVAPEEQLNESQEAICERIRELLLDAIKIQLRADVPVGCYLSGGLDSSIIASQVVRHFDGDVRTFGIRFEEERFDEGEYQRAMVDALQVKHREILASNAEIGSLLPEVLWHVEKPILRTGPIPLFLLSGLVRESGYKVVLTGEGADEIFGGYNIFREAKVRAFWARQPGSRFRPLLLKRLYPYVFGDPRSRQMLQSFFGAGLERAGDPFFSHAIRWQSAGRLKTFMTPEARAAAEPERDRESLRAQLPPGFEKADVVARAQYLETLLFLSNYLLSSQGDRVAMAHSVELRVPFLDHRVIELMAKVPSRLKIRGMTEKYILRETFRGSMPDMIVNRGKHPYRAPIKESLLQGRAREMCLDALDEGRIRRTALFDAGKVQSLVRKLDSSVNVSEQDAMALVGILSTQLVQEQFVEGFGEGRWREPRPDRLVDRRSAGASTPSYAV